MKTDSRSTQELRHKAKKGSNPAPIDNTDFQMKINIRHLVVTMLGGIKECSVLEAFAGEGHIYDACYTKAIDHIAFDIKSIKRPGWIQGDNNILLPKHINGGYNLYDLDAYSDPWTLAAEVARLRDSGIFGMVLTCSQTRNLHAGNLSPYMRRASGYGHLPKNPLVARYYDELIELCVSDWARHGVKVLRGWRARSNAFLSKTRYYGFLLDKS